MENVNYNPYKYKNGRKTHISEGTWKMMPENEKIKYTDVPDENVLTEGSEINLNRKPIRVPIEYENPKWKAEDEQVKDYQFYKDFYDKNHEFIEQVNTNRTKEAIKPENKKADKKKVKTIKEQTDGNTEQENV